MNRKAANMADWIESRLHREFTVLMDDGLAEGRLTRDERIALSGAIGSALEVFHTILNQEDGALLALRRRHPYEEADPESRYRHPYGGPPLQAGKNLVKSLGGDRIGGYAVLWGDATHRDLADEWFAPDTAELTTIFEATKRLPLLYQHAADGRMLTSVVGLVEKMAPDDVGLWYEAQLTMGRQYRQAIEQLIEQGELGTSSGTLPAARRVDRRTGKVVRWPVVELSLTPTPAEPRMMMRPVAEIKAAFEAVGVSWEPLDLDTARTPSRSADGADLDTARTPTRSASSGNNGDYAKGGLEEPAEGGGEPLPAKRPDRAEIERELMALELMDMEV